MAHCININHPEINKYVEEFTFTKTEVAAVIAVWQEESNNFDRFPTIDEFRNEIIVEKEKDILLAESPEVNKIESNIKFSESNKISSFAKANNLNLIETDINKKGNKTYNFVFDTADKYGISIDNTLATKDDLYNLGVNNVLFTQAFYNIKTNKIKITENFSKLYELDRTRIVAHEALHGIITNKVKSLDGLAEINFKANINAFINKLRTNPKFKQFHSIDRVLKIIDSNKEYGYQELITYAFTDSEFAAALNSVIIEGKDNDRHMTFWEKLKELILSVISDDYTMFDELTDLLDAHLEINDKHNPGIYELGFNKKIAELESNFISNDYSRKLAELNKDEAETLHQKFIESDYGFKQNKLLKDVEDKLKAFLESVGIKYESVAIIKDSKGNVINSVAKADIFNKIVQVIEGKRNFSTLPEETAHIFVAMIRGTEMYNSMMDKITRFKIYQDVLDEYKDVHTEEFEFKEEAIGKLISIQILNQAKLDENALNEDLFTKWWNKVWTIIKDFLGSLKSSDMSPFIQSAKEILEGRIDGLMDLDKVIQMSGPEMHGLVYYEMSSESINKRNELEKKLTLENSDKSTLIYNVKDHSYTVRETGRIVKHSVSDYEYKYYLSHNSNIENTEKRKIHAAKSVYVSQLAKEIMNEIISGNKNISNSRLDIIDKVANKLIDNEIINEFANNKKAKNSFFLVEENQFSEIISGMQHIYDQIQSNSKRIKKYTEGAEGEAKIYTGLNLYKEDEDLSTSIDIGVLYPNGSFGFYDLKGIVFFKDLITDKIELSKIKENAYQAKMFQMKRLLKDSFGITDFAESRIFPMNIELNYESKYGISIHPLIGIAKLEMVANQDKEYLQQIPAKDELVTEDAPLSEGLKTLIKFRESLEKRLEQDKTNENLISTLQKTDKSIKEIQLNRNAVYIYNEIAAMFRQIKQIEVEPTVSPNYYYEDFNNYLEYAKIFRNVSKKLIDESGSTLMTDKNKNKLIAIEAILSKIENIAYQKIIEVLNQNQKINITSDIVETSNIAGVFKRLEWYDAQAFRRMSKLVTINEDNIRRELNDIIVRIGEKQDALISWAKSKGKSEMEAYKVIVNFDKGSLITQFKKEYFDELNKARKEKNIDWLKNNLEVKEEDKAKYEENLDALERKLLRDYPDEFDSKGNLTEYGQTNEKERKSRIMKFKSKFDVWDPNFKNAAYLNKFNPYLKIKDNPKYYSEEWKKLIEKGNEPLFEYYKQYTELMSYFNKLVEEPIRKNFIPSYRQKTLDRIGQVGVGAAVNLMREFAHSLEAVEYDISERKIDPLTGKEIPVIPLMGYHPLKDIVSKEELKQIQDEVSELGFEKNNLNYEIEVKKRVNKLEYEKALQTKSYDLTKSLILFAKSVLTNKFYNDTFDEIKAVQNLIHSDKISTIKTDIVGKPKKIKDSNELFKVVGVSSSDMDAFDSYVKLYWHGLEIQHKDFGIRSKPKVDENGNVISEGKLYSGIKMYKWLSNLTTLKALPLNIPAAFANAIGLWANANILASEGILFTKQQLLDAEKAILNQRDKNHKISKMASSFFEPNSRDLSLEKANKKSATLLSKWLTVDTLMTIWKKPDDWTDEIVLNAMLKNYGFSENNEIKRLSRLPKGTKSLFELSEIKNDKYYLPGITDNQTNFLTFKKLVRSASEKIKGVASQENKDLIGKNIFTRALMKFRTWIPGLAKARFENLKYDEDTEEFDVGRFRILMDEWLRAGSVHGIFMNFKNLLFEIALNMPIISKLKGDLNIYKKGGINQHVLKIKYEEFMSKPENAHLRDKVSMQEFANLRMAKLTGAAKELSIILTLFLLVALTKAALPDDDEEFIKKAIAKSSYRAINRALLEVTFFSNPMSIDEIISSPSADWSTIVSLYRWAQNTLDVSRDLVAEGLDIGDPKYHAISEKTSKDKTPMMYRTLGLVPALGQIIKFLDVFDETVK